MGLREIDTPNAHGKPDELTANWYVNFANEFYESNTPIVNANGLNRTLESFHLVDMYPSLKAMEPFNNQVEFAQLIKENRSTNNASIYIHFPFCKNICSYCHLYKEKSSFIPEFEGKYVEAVKNEVAMYTNLLGSGINARSIYFGGGTPSLMSYESLKSITDILRASFTITEETFISFEVFPDSNMDKGDLVRKLAHLKEFGVKEIVLDLQSSNQKSLDEVGRANTGLESWKEAIKIAKSVGIPNIKTSMIIGLPYDTLESFQQSVIDISQTEEVSTISLFLLEFRKGLRVHRDLEKSSYKFCSAAEREKMQILARKTLTDNNFVEGPLHFFKRRKEKQDKPSVLSATQSHLIGLGPSAYGHIVLKDKAIKLTNTSNVFEYSDKVNAGKFPFSRWKILSRSDQLFSEIIDDLTSDGLLVVEKVFGNLNKTEAGRYKEILGGFIELGLLIKAEKGLVVTEMGKLRIEEMLWYLYSDKYKELQRQPSSEPDLVMHNYVTILTPDEEEKFKLFLKSISNKL